MAGAGAKVAALCCRRLLICIGVPGGVATPLGTSGVYAVSIVGRSHSSAPLIFSFLLRHGRSTGFLETNLPRFLAVVFALLLALTVPGDLTTRFVLRRFAICLLPNLKETRFAAPATKSLCSPRGQRGSPLGQRNRTRDEDLPTTAERERQLKLRRNHALLDMQPGLSSTTGCLSKKEYSEA